MHTPDSQAAASFSRARQSGDDASDVLGSAVYEELRRIARGLMRRQPSDHTLQATALLHEAILRLQGGRAISGEVGRDYFYASAVRAMRDVLVDHARRRSALCRGRDYRRLPFEAVLNDHGFEPDRFAPLNEALDELTSKHERVSLVVQLRFFGGFTEAEIASELGISVPTVQRDFRFGRAWLRRCLRETESP